MTSKNTGKMVNFQLNRTEYNISYLVTLYLNKIAAKLKNFAQLFFLTVSENFNSRSHLSKSIVIFVRKYASISRCNLLTNFKFFA